MEQILERRGGNCNELAQVTMAMAEELDLPMRRVREITISEDMIAPFAIFAQNGQGSFAENRTSHYLVDGFDALYGGRLRQLAAWPDRVRRIDELDEKPYGVFPGEVAAGCGSGRKAPRFC